MSAQTSIFDPVLCEVIYRWFCPEHGKVLDPFAGGLPRGAVAYAKGLDYLGIDLSKEQVESNRELIKNIEGRGKVEWVNDDSAHIGKYADDESFDLIFSCPPYFDLEKYSDDPKDLSNMDYEHFVKAYCTILHKTAAKLKNNRFAVIVLSDVRDKNGGYHLLCDLTRKTMVDEGFCVYNELILLNTGTAHLRAKKNFIYRKNVRTHQEVMVFYKGDPKMIQSEFGILQAEDDVLNQDGSDE